MIHYLYKNIKNIILKEKFLFAVILIVQVISVMAILFSYGVIEHYNTKNKVTQGTMLEMDICFSNSDGDKVPASALLDNHNRIIKSIEKKLSYEYVMSSCDRYMIDATLNYSGGNIVEGESDKNLYSAISEGGRCFDKKEKMDGSKVVIVCASSKKYDNNILLINDEKYDIIAYAYENLGEEDTQPFLVMPIMSLPENAEIKHLMLEFSTPLDINEYTELKNICIEAFGNNIEIPEFVALDDIEDTRTNNTIILAGIILIMFAAVNYCMIYRYILEKRKRTLAIYRICGCTKGKVVLTYMIEMLGISMMVFIILVPLYHYMILDKIGKIFEYMNYYYGKLVYLKLFMAYMFGLIVSYAVLVASIVKKTPLMLTKEGEV